MQVRNWETRRQPNKTKTNWKMTEDHRQIRYKPSGTMLTMNYLLWCVEPLGKVDVPQHGASEKKLAKHLKEFLSDHINKRNLKKNFTELAYKTGSVGI